MCNMPTAILLLEHPGWGLPERYYLFVEFGLAAAILIGLMVFCFKLGAEWKEREMIPKKERISSKDWPK